METMTTKMELPEGCELVELGKLVHIKGGKRLAKGAPFANGITQFPYLRVTDFTNGTIQISNLKYIDEEVQAKIARYIIRKEDVYISIAGSIGLIGIVPDELDGANLTENAARLVIKNESQLDRDYLAKYLAAEYGQQQIQGLTTKTTQPKLALARIALIKIPLFPLPKQRAIARVLGAVQAALAARRREQQLEQEHKAALLEHLFTRGTCGEKTRQTEIGEVPVSWEVTVLKKVFEGGGKIQTGPFGSQLHSYDYLPEGIPVLNPTHLGANAISKKAIPRISPEKATELTKHFLKEGDILISRRGDFSHYAYITPDFSGGLCGTGCFLLRIKSMQMDNYFLSVWLGMRVAQDYLRNNAVGTIMPNLNTSILNAVPVVIPPLPEQQRIAAVLGALDVKLAALTVEVARLEELFRALLEELLSGRLRVDIAE